MYGAQPVEEAQAPGLYRIVRELAAEAKIPVPPIYIMQDDSPNAFATGRNPSHAAVAVTEGILRIMSEDELNGMLLMAVLAPFAAMLIQMAISRSREYEADASGARLCHRASGLEHALAKL